MTSVSFNMLFLKFFSWVFLIDSSLEVDELGLPLIIIIINLVVILYICAVMRLSEMIQPYNAMYPLDGEHSDLFRKLKTQSEHISRRTDQWRRHDIYESRYWASQVGNCALNVTDLLHLRSITRQIPEDVLDYHGYYKDTFDRLKVKDEGRNAWANDKLINLLTAQAVSDFYPHLNRR